MGKFLWTVVNLPIELISIIILINDIMPYHAALLRQLAF